MTNPVYIRLLANNTIEASLRCESPDPDSGPFFVRALSLKKGNSEADIELHASVSLPAAAVDSSSGVHRLKRLADLENTGEEASYRQALHAISVTKMATSGGFLGMAAPSSAEGILELDIEAVVDGTSADVSVTGRLSLHTRLSANVQALRIDGAAPSSVSMNLDLRLVVAFDADITATLEVPVLQFSLLPKILRTLNLPDLGSGSWNGASPWELPKWLSGLALPITLSISDPTANITAAGFSVNVGSLQLKYQNAGNEVALLTATGVTLDSAGNSSVATITLAKLTVPQASVKNPLSLPLDINLGEIKIQPVLDPDSSLALKVEVSSLDLVGASGSALQFRPVTFTVERSGIKEIRAKLTDGAVSEELVLAIADLAAGTAQAVASLAQWTFALGQSAVHLLGRLLDFLRRLVLSSPQLPSVGPIGAAFSALMNYLQDAVAGLSVQLVFDRSTHRLLRTIVSARRQPKGQDLLVQCGGPALSLRLESNSGHSRVALVVEHLGPTAGDWCLAAVPDTGGPFLQLNVGTDLWLRPGGDKTQLAQDRDEQGGLPSEPLIQLRADTKKSFALAIFGVRSGRALWFQRFDDSALKLEEVAGNDQVRLSLANGTYGVRPLGDDDFDLNFTWQLGKLKRLLPFLNDPDDDPGSEPSDRARLVRIAKYEFVEKKLFLELEFGSEGDPLARATVQAAWNLTEWRLELAETIKFELVERKGDNSTPGRRTWKFLGLDWTLEVAETDQRKRPAFVLTIGDDPGLQLADGAKLSITTDAFGSAEGQRLEFDVKPGGFAVSRSGISLDATLRRDQRVKLDGIETSFELSHADLVIRNNRIQEFVVAGAGSLPAWVGDGKVDARFRFGQNANRRFRLLGAAAELQFPGKPIEAKAMRFQFSLRQVELAFESKEAESTGKLRNEFYFLVSGSAEFKPNGEEFSGGLLQHLKNAKIELNRAPLTASLGELLRGLKFTVPLSKPETIRLFNLFEFEIRSVGFALDAFGKGEHGISLGGQCKFAEAGDVVSADIDFHSLVIGRPNGDNPLPRVRFEGLRVAIAVASRIRIGGTVMAVDRDLPLTSLVPDIDPGLSAKGFVGDGEVEIPGMPTLSGSFGFLEIARVQNGRTRRYLSWFVYLQANKLSYQVPAPIPLYIREIGLGLGFRYTLAGMATADKAKTTAELIKELDELATRQGDMARYSAWQPQTAGIDSEPQVTLAMRALLTMASASPPQAHVWDAKKELHLVSPLTMDVVAALRSDFTFLMTARIWLAVNYNDFLAGGESLRTRPLVRGFMYLSGPKQEFLARLASVDNPHIGDHPIIPDLVQRALKSVQYSATLYMRPGLLHFELGWPNHLRWRDKFGPLVVDCSGGFVFRVQDGQLLLGISFAARGTLELSAQVGGSNFGASISALSDVAFVARIIALIDARDVRGSMFYGLVALDLLVRFAVAAWLYIKVFRKRIGTTIRFSFSLQLTVALELVLTGDPDIAGRARCRVALRAFGRTLTLQVNLAHNAAKVDRARARVQRYLDLGLSGPAELPDPFGDSARAMVSRAGLRSKAAFVASTPTQDLKAAKFQAIVRPVAWKPGYLLVVLVPKEDPPGFYCAPRFIKRGGKLKLDTTDADYKWGNLPTGSQVYDGNKWDENSKSTRVNWKRELGGEKDATLADLLHNAFIDTLNADDQPPVYRDPPLWPFAREVQAAGGGSAEERGRDLHDREVGADPGAAPDAEGEAHDARDLLLAQLLDAMVAYAGAPAEPSESLVTDLGLALLVPENNDLAGALRNIELERLDPVGGFTKCSVCCAAIELHMYEENGPRGGVRLDQFQARFNDEHKRAEFAWDLTWRGAPPGSDDPEEYLFAYEVRREVIDDDRIGRTWRVRPVDNVVVARNGDGTIMTTSAGRPVRMRQRPFLQFEDDFQDLQAPPYGKEIDYSVTPLARDGSRGLVRRVTLRVERRLRMPAPVHAEVDFVLGLSDEQEVSLDGIDLRLRMPKEPISDQTADEEIKTSPEQARIVLRSEPLRLGGHYGIDQASQTNETLGAEFVERESDLTFDLPLEPVGDGRFQGSDSTVPPEVISALQSGRGRVAWRAFIRVVGKVEALEASVQGEESTAIPAELRLVRKRGANATQVPVPTFEWPFASTGTQMLSLSGVAGSLRARGARQETAFSDEVGVALRWPYRVESGPPVAGYQLYELELDEVPPRLLDSERKLRPEAGENARLLAELTLAEPDLLPLNPNHNRDAEAWAGTYTDATAGQQLEELTVDWPSPRARHILPRIEATLLSHLRSAMPESNGVSWPAYIAVRAQDSQKKPKKPEDVVSIPQGRLTFEKDGGFFEKQNDGLDPYIALFRINRDSASEREFIAALRALRIMGQGEELWWPYRIEIAPLNDPTRPDPLLWFEVVPSKCHPDLIAFAECLAEPHERVEYQAAFEDEATFQHGDDLVRVTPESADPMGFGILHRLGMAVTIRIWNAKDRQYMGPEELEKRVAGLGKSEDFANIGLHVDQLLQTDGHLEIRPFDSRMVTDDFDIGSRGLSMLQISLRPRRAEQRPGAKTDPTTEPTSQTVDHYGTWWRLRGLPKPNVNAEDEYKGADDKPREPRQRNANWERRFLRHHPPPPEGNAVYTRTFAARQGAAGDLVAPDRQGFIRWLRRSKDLHAHVRAYAVAAVGRYDDLLFRVLGQDNQPKKGSEAEAGRQQLIQRLQSRLAATPLDPGSWHAVRLDRSKPVSAPQIIWQGQTSLQVDGSSVPVWEVAMAQHAEQALSEANDLTATRLQFRGLALRLRREPRDAGWIDAVLKDLYKHGQILQSEDLNYLRMPEHALATFNGSQPLEQALQQEDYRGPRSPALPLWQGMTVQRFPALPYFYRHHLEVKSRAGLRESENRWLEEAAPDGPTCHEESECEPVLNDDGCAELNFFPTLYHHLIDPIVDEIVGEPTGNTGQTMVRHAPDPDVQYRLVLREADIEEPLLHVLRDARAETEEQRAYRTLPLGRRFIGAATLRARIAELDPTHRLQMGIELLRTQEIVVEKVPSDDDQKKLAGLVSFELPKNGPPAVMRVLRVPRDSELPTIRSAWPADQEWVDARVIAPLIERWLFSGNIAVDPRDNWPAGIERECVTEFELDGAALKSSNKWRDWLDVDRVSSSVWRLHPLRTELRAAILQAVAASSTVTVQLRGVDFGQVGDVPTPGLRIRRSDRTGRWLAFGAVSKAMRDAVKSVAGDEQAAALKDEGLRRALGYMRAAGAFWLNRSRGRREVTQ